MILPSAFFFLMVASAGELTGEFELPPGFHIYKVAGPELSGGSYDLAFDGQGRLLVGDGIAVRRLVDRDGDEVFDDYEVIATGLGPRGPQGLLVDGDRLLAVGGDGLQVFEGYKTGGPLRHRGRIGAPFSTGDDHDAHTLMRGHDGYLYMVTGNEGVGRGGHITEAMSPSRFEREASVFRIDPEGKRWECLATGGRNPPNLGQNELGDFFSLDSDMEGHVGLPWYRPVRLNHWIAGSDQGWKYNDALRPYFIDTLPAVLEVGRGSPDWGVFYEHRQLPEKYRGAFLVNDYPWKNVRGHVYVTSGRLLAFFLRRQGAGWTATMEVLARPRPGARDGRGQPIQFALVDVEVAPDGSVYLSDHNQGIWRLFFSAGAHAPGQPPRVPPPEAEAREPDRLLERMLVLPQPGAEWSRIRLAAARASPGAQPFGEELQKAALSRARPLVSRLRAIRLLAPDFAALPGSFLGALARDPRPEVRGQAAWLRGIRGRDDEVDEIAESLRDGDPFVRRRSAEALSRAASPRMIPALVGALADPVRPVRYAAMVALSRQPQSAWWALVSAAKDPQVRLRGLAVALRRDPPPFEAAARVVTSLLRDLGTTGWRARPDARRGESRLDLLRIAALLQDAFDLGAVAGGAALAGRITDQLLQEFPDRDPRIRWEQIRVLGLYRASRAHDALVRALVAERDFVAQFHLARALARIAPPADAREQDRLADWIVGTQTGWFAKLDDKGSRFAGQWQTVLTDLGRHHQQRLLGRLADIDPAGGLGRVALDLIAGAPDGDARLIGLYRTSADHRARVNILGALRRRPTAAAGDFLRAELRGASDRELRAALLSAASALPPAAANLALIREELESDDELTARAAAKALAALRAPADEALATTLLARLGRERESFEAYESALGAASGASPPGHRERRPVEESLAFWKAWYAKRFGKSYAPAIKEHTDDELVAYIMKADLLSNGSPRHGQAIYEQLQCVSCHGGIGAAATGGPSLGPDLAGVTRRLSRAELTDALVFPSRQVADRFRATLIELEGGESLTGFITDQNAQEVAIVDRTGVHRVAVARIKSMAPQSISLMPERLLAFLSWEDLQDLLAFLANGESLIGSRPK